MGPGEGPFSVPRLEHLAAPSPLPSSPQPRRACALQAPSWPAEPEAGRLRPEFRRLLRSPPSEAPSLGPCPPLTRPHCPDPPCAFLTRTPSRLRLRRWRRPLPLPAPAPPLLPLLPGLPWGPASRPWPLRQGLQRHLRRGWRFPFLAPRCLRSPAGRPPSLRFPVLQLRLLLPPYLGRPQLPFFPLLLPGPSSRFFPCSLSPSPHLLAPTRQPMVRCSEEPQVPPSATKCRLLPPSAIGSGRSATRGYAAAQLAPPRMSPRQCWYGQLLRFHSCCCREVHALNCAPPNDQAEPAAELTRPRTPSAA